jgi:alkylation response protein AidB-like acyl-CoA dehydrogenase
MIDLGLSQEQRDIAESASRLLREHSPISRLRQPGSPEDVQRMLAAWGWFAVGLPADAGGLGLTVAEEALLYLEAGQFLLSPSVLATTLAAGLVDEPLRVQLLDGSRRAALALPADGGSVYCLDRGQAAVVVMIDGDETAIYPSEAFAGEIVAGLDETLVLEKGELDGHARLAKEPGHRTLLLVAAMLVGTAKASSELSVDYAKTREQFGQPIGAFQAVKHRCVNMALQAFSAEAQLLMAAACTAEGTADAAFQTVAAAHSAINAARSNGAAAIQVHGGMGFTTECDAHLFLKRAHVLARLIGGAERQEASLLASAAPTKR